MANGDNHIARVESRALSLIDGALDDAQRLDGQLGALGRVRDALGHLRALGSIAEMTDRVVAELCDTCGFDRAVFFRIEDGRLLAHSAHFSGESEWCRRFLATARDAPVALRQPLAEAEVLRERRAMVILDPLRDPRALCPLIRAARPSSYVVAPVICEQRVVGMLHADRLVAERAVDGRDRDLLWAFAEGFGYALERAMLIERLHEQRARILRSLDGELEPLDALRDPGRTATRVPRRGGSDRERDRIEELIGDADSAALPLPLPLTRRELEVLQLIAAGATNQKIADVLVISEQTVKSHVKNILRKLGASNRTEAASRLGPTAVR
jgi:DNA-binding CsgD family transcriptional regulator